MDPFGTLLAKISSDNDLSQADLARLLGVSRPEVNDWLKGRRKPPKDFSRRVEGLPISPDQRQTLVRAAMATRWPPDAWAEVERLERELAEATARRRRTRTQG